jgi:hypothetical protein
MDALGLPRYADDKGMSRQTWDAVHYETSDATIVETEPIKATSWR